MQTDMHYYGTYVLARCAGLKEDIARAIATAAEYVDDSDKLEVTLADGTVVSSEATAHHPENTANFDPDDQRRTWVPFHFIPGNQGDNDATRLMCQMDSINAQEMVRHHVDHAAKEDRYGALLIGIAAHVYADTFSHYGFSGVSSKVNRIATGSIECAVESAKIQISLSSIFEKFFNNYIAGPFVGRLSGLGHGSVASYPDQPYLRWQFQYADGRHSGWRDNPTTFLLAAQKLYEMFVSYRKAVDGDYDDLKNFREFSEIKHTIAKIFAVEGDADIRRDAWNHHVQVGDLYANPNSSPIPRYDSSSYLNDLSLLPTLDLTMAKRTLVYSFIEAASVHRNYVFGILATQGINVENILIEWEE